MYVRIARFEGAEGNWDERIEEVRNRIRGTSEAVAGSPMEGARGGIKRAMMLVDRENGRGASVIFCDSEDDLRRVDAGMNQMSPPPGGGSRASVEVYEVAVDEQPS
jgi:hypothetical protein